MDYRLYGDGITPDTAAIQALLDSGKSQIVLPQPKVCYTIDRPLKIYSCQELVLPRFCRIRLADGSNCHMLENGDQNTGSTDIRITGGIWDYNNLGQLPNPFHFPQTDFPDYDGQIFFLKNIRNLTISNLTFKDPTVYACTLDTISYFTVENIRFDFNLGKPRPLNMDGVHLNGNCHFGVLRNLQGACHDDLVALNADEGSNGPITNITVDGIYAENCHSAVRLLTVRNRVEHIHITNVYGTYWQYCIGITKYYPGKTEGYFDSLVLDNIHASKAPRYPYLHVSEDYCLHGYVFPLIYIEGETHIKSLAIRDLYRVEECVPVSTIFAGEDSRIENLCIADCSCENKTGNEFVFFENHADIGTLQFRNNRMTGGKLLG